MELWQIDVMGGVMLEGGTELKAITGIDDHSRYCVMATLVHRATARPVCEALMDALSRYGVPEQILTDNGKVFTGRIAPKPSTVAFDRICLNNGIRQPADRPLLAHDHRQDRAAAQDDPQGAGLRAHVHHDRAGPGRARCLGRPLQR